MPATRPLTHEIMNAKSNSRCDVHPVKILRSTQEYGAVRNASFRMEMHFQARLATREFYAILEKKKNHTVY